MSYTSILKGEGKDIDFVNSFVVFLSTFASGMFLGFYGLNNSNSTLAGIGFLFSILSLSGVVIIYRMGGDFFKPKTTVEEGAFIFWSTALLLNIGSFIDIIGDNIFSSFTPPGNAYAASALAGEPAGIQTLVEVFFAPQGENLALIGLGTISVLYGVQQFGDNLKGLGAGLLPIGLLFAGIHTQQLALNNFYFLGTAMALIIGVGAVIYGSNLKVDVPFEDSLIATLSFFGGLHFGLNSSNTTGIIGAFIAQPEGILNIPSGELLFLAYGLTAIYGISFYYAVKYVYLRLN